jgi:uroporphyrinogen-III decarboxylase
VNKYVTPEGEIREVRKRTEHGLSSYPVEHFLKDEKSIDVFKYILEHRTYEFDWNRYKWGAKRYSDSHYPHAYLWFEPYLRLVVQMMGYQNTIIWLWKHPKEMEDLMELMTKDSEKQIEAFRGTPLVELCFATNMHENLCSPTQFKKYILPFTSRVVPQIHALGMYASAHWDGYCKNLLPLAKETGLDGLEAVTPEPQGDVTIEDMKKYIIDRGMYLRDGIPALLFTKYHSVEELEAFTKRMLDTLGKSGRLQLGVSDLFPANGEIERVKIVSEIVKKYNEGNFR